jgi:hypothetical protein
MRGWLRVSHPTHRKYEVPANPPFILFHAAFFWRCLSMMRRPSIRSYGAFGAPSRYRIKPMATPKACADSQGGGQILHLIEDERDGARHADLIRATSSCRSTAELLIWKGCSREVPLSVMHNSAARACSTIHQHSASASASFNHSCAGCGHPFPGHEDPHPDLTLETLWISRSSISNLSPRSFCCF